MSFKSDQTKELYQLRIKLRLDGRYCAVLSHGKLAFKITRDKKGEFHIFPHDKEWENKMIYEEGLQDYLSELLNCLHGYKFEVEKLEYQQYLMEVAFNKKPTI